FRDTGGPIYSTPKTSCSRPRISAILSKEILSEVILERSNLPLDHDRKPRIAVAISDRSKHLKCVMSESPGIAPRQREIEDLRVLSGESKLTRNFGRNRSRNREIPLDKRGVNHEQHFVPATIVSHSPHRKKLGHSLEIRGPEPRIEGVILSR